jgi:hypothetical protein
VSVVRPSLWNSDRVSLTSSFFWRRSWKIDFRGFIGEEEEEDWCFRDLKISRSDSLSGSREAFVIAFRTESGELRLKMLTRNWFLNFDLRAGEARRVR